MSPSTPPIVETSEGSVMPAPTALHRLAGFVGAAYLHFFGQTSFLYEDTHPAAAELRRKPLPMIYAFWHNQQVFLCYNHRNERINAVVSRSKDGEYIAQIMARMGLMAVRGSSSRGGAAALRGVLKILRAGGKVAFTPDGPRGPVGSVQPGVVATAQLSGVPIVPMSAGLSRMLEFRSWDRFRMPLPFAVTVSHIAEPFLVPRDMPIDEAAAMVRAALDASARDAEAALAFVPGYVASFVAGTLYLVYAAAVAVLSPLLLAVAAFKYGRRRAGRGLTERLGFGEVPPVAPGRRRLWLHAASLGEWQALKPLLEKIDADRFETFVTTSAPEARDIIARDRPGQLVRLIPLDWPGVVVPWVRRVRPDAAVFIETEIWPCVLEALRSERVPAFIANGRLSARGVRRWAPARPLVARSLCRMYRIWARSREDADRFVALGTPPNRVRVTGNTKWDALSVFSEADRLDIRSRFAGGVSRVLVAGSTWPGEEEFLFSGLKGLSSRPLLVVAPRRLDRVTEVCALARRHGLAPSLWTGVKQGEPPADVIVVDTAGDLRRLYAAADVAFVGGSVSWDGGQNPLEPAAAGAAIVFGPGMRNFREEAATLISSGAALQGGGPGDTWALMGDLLADPARASRMGAAGRGAVIAGQGASAAIAAEIRSFFPL